MARYVPRFLDSVLNYNPDPFTEDLTSYASKAARVKILLDRETRGFEKVDRDGGPGAYEHERTDRQGNDEKDSRTILRERQGDLGGNINNDGYLKSPVNTNPRPKDILTESISIVDIDAIPNSMQSVRYYSYLTLPFVPRELSYNPESDFVGIPSFGRNNPFYQFTGSEDTLTFDIDWFSNQNNREDVIFNCRWIEALTKGDGYKDIPHRVKIVWGTDNKLFHDSIWLVTSAPYRLSQFVKGYTNKNGEIIRVGMLPQQAYQTVTLKRISNRNRTSTDIIGKLPNNL